MKKRQAIETLDRSLQDIMDCSDPFGGKVVVFGGDFRQFFLLCHALEHKLQMQPCRGRIYGINYIRSCCRLVAEHDSTE
jgi:hypothetical protein